MDVERRLFLKSLVGASVAYCFMSSIPLIGERYSLLAEPLVTSNGLVTPTWVTQEVARGFLNNIYFIRQVNREYACI